MTDGAPTPATPARARRRRTAPLAIAATSLVAFVGSFGVLAGQMRSGADPALHAGRPAFVSTHGGAAVRTSASGAAVTAAPAGSAGHARGGAPLVTRASASGGEHDD